MTWNRHLRIFKMRLIYRNKEVINLRGEKDTLQKVLDAKADDLRKSMLEEGTRLDMEMKEKFSLQKKETNQLKQKVNVLSNEKTELQKTVVNLQAKLADLEMIVGGREH